MLVSNEQEKQSMSFKKINLHHYCETCQKVCKSNFCGECKRSDLPFINNGNVDYDNEVLVDYEISRLKPIDSTTVFDDYLVEAFGEVVLVGDGSYEIAEALKSIDPYSYELKKDEYLRNLVKEAILIEVGSNYYWLDDCSRALCGIHN